MNDDLIGLVVSYLDITSYMPDQRKSILLSIGATDYLKVLSVWWKSSSIDIIQVGDTVIKKMNGKEHCETGFAVENKFVGYQQWWVNGLRHRVEGPAVEFRNGHREWWVNGLRHRVEGPAVEYPSGNSVWWFRGVKHREGGPAVEGGGLTKEWWVNGELHRDDGPALVHPGYEEWWFRGKKHRVNGPAIDWVNLRCWYSNGVKHRENGPAVEHKNGFTEWWVNGKRVDYSCGIL